MLSNPTELLANTSLHQETIHAPLRDLRRQQRYAKIVETLAEKPDASIPEAMKTEAALEAYYRLMRNPSVNHFNLLQAHFENTQERCEPLNTVLVVHDTTTFAFEVRADFEREHLARLSTKQQGFSWRAALAISADHQHAPMGLIASQPFVHKSLISDAPALQMWQSINGIVENHDPDSWMDNIENSMQLLDNMDKVIHLIDCEGDAYRTLFPMHISGYSYVVRMLNNQILCSAPASNNKIPLHQALQNALWIPAAPTPTTPLKLRAATLQLYRPDSIPADQAPAHFTANVLEILETLPTNSQPPQHWFLITDQPIDSPQACQQILNHYRARHQINTYFHALKIDAAYDKIQHKQTHTLLNALSAKAIVAWHLLVKRHLTSPQT